MNKVQPAATGLVSIILPAYNAEQTVARAVDSCLQQTYADIELIVINDGSTDRTAALLSDRMERDQRMRVITTVNRGVTDAFNLGLREARGKFIARMDADDEMHPEKIEKQVSFLQAHPAIGVVSCLVHYGGDRVKQEGYARHVDWINSLLTPEQISINRFVDSPVCNPTVLFRAELWQQHGAAFNGNFPEDYEMWLRWMNAGVHFTKVPEVLFTWNDLPSRLTRNHSRYSGEAFERAKAYYLQLFVAAHNTRQRPVYLCGTGRITRKKSAVLKVSALNIAGYIDIDPKKIGTRIDGLPVIGLDDVLQREQFYIINYVSVRGAREGLTALFNSKGLEEGADFIHAQ